MTTPFSILHNDVITVTRPNKSGVTGLGKVPFLPPFTLRGKILLKDSTRRTDTGDFKTSNGKLRYDHQSTKLVKGDLIEFNGLKLVIDEIEDRTGGLYQVPREKVAWLKWQVSK